jgi:hypothetical protein
MPTVGTTRASRQSEWWSAVRLSVVAEVVHVGSSIHAGVQDTTRQVSRPTQETCWLQRPYRNVRQPVRRLKQLPLAQSHPGPESQSGQNPVSQPVRHPLQTPEQSM